MNRPASRILSRCQYHTATGRQCRYSAAHDSNLCLRHTLESQRNSDLTELFTTAHDKFVSPAGIHASLSELFTLLAENRVAPRRAAVLAYIGSLMLRTLPAIQEEVAAEMAAAKAKNAKPANPWNIPRATQERPTMQQPNMQPPVATTEDI